MPTLAQQPVPFAQKGEASTRLGGFVVASISNASRSGRSKLTTPLAVLALLEAFQVVRRMTSNGSSPFRPVIK